MYVDTTPQALITPKNLIIFVFLISLTGKETKDLLNHSSDVPIFLPGIASENAYKFTFQPCFFLDRHTEGSILKAYFSQELVRNNK